MEWPEQGPKACQDWDGRVQVILGEAWQGHRFRSTGQERSQDPVEAQLARLLAQCKWCVQFLARFKGRQGRP